MAVVSGNNFVTGTCLPVRTSGIARETKKSSVMHVLCDSNSPGTMQGTSEINSTKHIQEIPSFIDHGLRRRGSLWWATIFKVSTEDDESFLTASTSREEAAEQPGPFPASVSICSTSTESQAESINQPKSDRRTRRSAFTEEKARALRKSRRDLETWHDGWYHSSIASRLAEPEE